jgi:hypothetical protein
MSAVIRPLTRADLPEARRICCAAFGTFLGAPDPENFWADRDYVHGWFGAENVASFAAELDGELVGSNFATRWGSVGFIGPITMRPSRTFHRAETSPKADVISYACVDVDGWTADAPAHLYRPKVR